MNFPFWNCTLKLRCTFGSLLAPLNCQFPLFPDIVIDKYGMEEASWRSCVTPPCHDGHHDDEDGVKDDEEHNVRLVRSVVHNEFTQTSERKKSGRLLDSIAPLCTSDNKGFKKLVELLDKDITIPGRRAITELIDKKFVDMMSMSKKLRKRLAKARWVHRWTVGATGGAALHSYYELQFTITMTRKGVRNHSVCVSGKPKILWRWRSAEESGWL